MTTTHTPITDTARTEACAEKVFGWIIGAEQTTALYLGDRLGWYRSLADDGPATPGELARRTGTAPRYAREWLEQQAVSGLLEVDDPAAAPDDRRFSVPAAHVPVLADPDSDAFIPPFALHSEMSKPMRNAKTECASGLRDPLHLFTKDIESTARQKT